MAAPGLARAALILSALAGLAGCRGQDGAGDALISSDGALDAQPGDGGTVDPGRDAARQCVGYPKVPTGVQSRSTTVNGKPRSYLLSVPLSYDATAPIPLIFAWHDNGESAAQARLAFDLESQAPGTAVFVYPEALPPAFAGDPRTWDMTPGGDDVSFFDMLTLTLTSQICVDRLRIFSAGHGRGGTFSGQLACLRGETLRAVASVAGMGPTIPCEGGKAIWIVAGKNDPLVSVAEATATRDSWLAYNGCSDQTLIANPWPCVHYLGCRVDQPVRWCIHDGKHDWPAFAPSGTWGFFMSFNQPTVAQ